MARRKELVGMNNNFDRRVSQGRADKNSRLPGTGSQERELKMNLNELQCSTRSSDVQLQPTTRARLIELAEAKLRLYRYRANVIGSSKSEAVSRLLDAIQRLEAAEGRTL